MHGNDYNKTDFAGIACNAGLKLMASANKY